MSYGNGLAAWRQFLQQEGKPGHCPGCERMLPPQKTKPPTICGKRDCRRLYHSIYDGARRDATAGQGVAHG